MDPEQSLIEHFAPILTARVAPHRPPLPLEVGTRASPLALAQTREFLSLLSRVCPVLRGMQVFREHAIVTTGDAVQDRPLAAIGGKGLFAKEIHAALMEGRIDFAVHSLKDLETTLPPGLVLGCVLTREDRRDALLLSQDLPAPVAGADALDCLPEGATIGTCSVRRQAQLWHARPDLRMVALRGNVQTRLAKLAEGRFDASLLAYAGLRRLDLAREAAVVLPEDVMLPAACQGIVGITVREADTAVRGLLAAIEDKTARIAATAERALQAALDGTCSTPIGAAATVSGDTVRLTGLVASLDGTFLRRISGSAGVADAARLGREIGLELRALAPAGVLT